MNTNKKTCPKCARQLPVTASNCKYCGASLQEGRGPSLFDGMGLPSRPPAAPSGVPAPPSALRPGFSASQAPFPPVSAPVADEADDWIPDTDEQSALIQLDQLPVHNAAPISNVHQEPVVDDEVTNPTIVRASIVPPSEDLTVVSALSESVNDQMVTGSPALFAPAGNPSAEFTLADEASAMFDLDNLEDPDDDTPPPLPIRTSSAPVPDEKVAAVFDDSDLVVSEESSPALSALIDLNEMNVEDSLAEIDLPSEESIVAIPPGGLAVGNIAPISTLPRPPSLPPSIPAAPVVRPSFPAASSAQPVISTPAPTYSQPPAAIAETPAQIAVTPSTHPSSFEPGPLSFSGSVPDRSVSGKDASLRFRLEGHDDDEVSYGETGHSNRKIILVSAGAFAVTLVIALAVVFAMNKPSRIEVVDASTLEPKLPDNSPSSVKSFQTDTATLAPEPADSSANEVVPTPATEEANAPNCLPISKYSKKFPWMEYFATLLQSEGGSKICDLFGTPQTLAASALSDMTMVGPTGFDWIVDGGRVEVFPGQKVGGREPSIEFLYSRGQLYKIKMKFRDLKIARRADADELKKVFKKEGESKDHLGRQIATFRDKDMKIVLIEEEWYGQTLRTLEFSSTIPNPDLDGHLQKLESLEKVYKAAETAYFGWNFDEAMERYTEVNSMAPGLGAALVKRALIYLRTDDFEKAASLAQNAIEVTREDDVTAEAKGVLAVNALREGNKKAALQLLSEASALSPDSTRYNDYQKQLQNAEYSVQNVAATAARLACMGSSKNKVSEEGILARGYFPDKRSYQKSLKAVSRSKEFKTTKKNLMVWECK